MGKFQRRAAITATAFLLIYAAIFFQLRDQLFRGYSDFISQYTAGKILARGTPHRLYDLQLQYEIQKEAAPNVPIRQAALPFVRPAFEAWIFWPLAYLPYSRAFVVWNLFSCGCLIAGVLLLRGGIPQLQKIPPLLLTASAFSFFPVFFTLLQGQDSILLFLVYVAAFRLLQRNRQFIGGMALGLGVFKFPLLLPFLVLFALKGKIRVVVGFIVTASLLAGGSIATIGASAARYYPVYLLQIDKLAQGIRPQDMPNLRGLLYLLLRAIAPRASMIVLICLSVLAIALVVHRWPVKSAEGTPAATLALALNVVMTVLVSYHCHVFDFCVLLLPIGLVVGFLLSDEPVHAKIRKRLILLLACLMFSPVYIVLVFGTNFSSILAFLLIAFAAVISSAISDLAKSSTLNATVVPAASL